MFWLADEGDDGDDDDVTANASSTSNAPRAISSGCDAYESGFAVKRKETDRQRGGKGANSRSNVDTKNADNN